MTNAYVEARAALDCALEVFYAIESYEDGIRVFDVVGRAYYASLELFRVKIGDTDSATVSFARSIHRFFEHLYGFDFFLSFQNRNLESLHELKAHKHNIILF